MSDHGYIYVRNWDKFQHYKDRRPPWIKLYIGLLGDDDWLELRPADWKLLCAIWMLTATHGNGRLRADQAWLMEQAKLPVGPRSRNLERLNHAGFIEVRASKAASNHASDSVPQRQRTDIPLTPVNGGIDLPELPTRLTREQRADLERKQKRQGAVHRCTFLYHQYLDEGETPAQVREHLEREYRHDPSIVTEAIGAA